jgi:catechol 2,3-dioxygenase-like lactoylglutathione lyase family enzyme
MADELKASTYEVDHVGLSVRDLASTRKFFCDCLGWQVVGERADYPAAFVSDRHDVVTLWQVEAPGKAIPFDRSANVGLRHLALAVVDQRRNSDYQGVVEYCGTIRG